MSGHVISVEVFNALYAAYSKRFVAIADSYLHDRTLSSDVVAECFLDLWERRHDIPAAEADLPRYLMGAVKHKCIDALRSGRSAEERLAHLTQRARIEADIRILGNDALTATVFRNEVQALFNRSLDTLPSLSRDVFLRSRLSGMTYAQIAADLGISERKVTAEMQKVLARLREDLKDYL